MSAFALYAIGFLVFIGGVLYDETLMHVPQTWVLVTALVLIGIGVMSAVSHTKRRDPPSRKNWGQSRFSFRNAEAQKYSDAAQIP
jgi:hypothetical protein